MNEDNAPKSIITVIKNNLPDPTIVFPMIIYVALSIFTMRAAHSDIVITYGDGVLPVAATAGVFSALSNLCLVFVVLHYKKPGFILAMIAIIVPMPSFLVYLIVQKNVGAIPGLFTNLFAILMIVIIMWNHVKMEKEHNKLQNLFTQTAVALVNSIDAKDKYTRGHSSRVANYSRRLAEMSGKDSEEIHEIFYSALLHDVGKIGVPRSIINKPGKLTKEEYDVVKQHPVMGAQILEEIDEYPYLSIGAHYHHERYDGAGYPEGLKGTDIPDLARIISVADAYDAMTSIRSYRDPIPQDKVREEIFKGAGTQFDPDYARLMLRLIDTDTEYEMKERSKVSELDSGNTLVIKERRSAIVKGLLINNFRTTVHITIGSEDENPGTSPDPSMILFDSLDGLAHSDEEEIRDKLYFEYGEIWFDGRTETKGARKMEEKIEEKGDPDIRSEGEYKIEAVRIKDHAFIRISGRERTFEVIVALPDSSRYLYLGFTGEHCSISNLSFNKAKTESLVGEIPRIVEEISYINVPAGDIPNVQVDGSHTDASESFEIKDQLKISFHTKSLPTARLVWHCPSVGIFTSDDGRMYGNNYRELAYVRLDGESRECDPNCSVDLNVSKGEGFVDWDNWKELNMKGYDVLITFLVKGSRITVQTENGGISIRNTVIINAAGKKIYAVLTGDQVALTDIKIQKPER